MTPTQNTLKDRIDERAPLADSEVGDLVAMLGSGCQPKTKERLARALHRVPYVENCGIYGRVHLRPVSYCAGQSYPDEIRAVRECLLGRL